MLSDSADQDQVSGLPSLEKLLSEIRQLLATDDPDIEHLNALLSKHLLEVEQLFNTHDPADDEQFGLQMREHSNKVAKLISHCSEQHLLLGKKLGSLNRGRKVLNKYNQNA